MSRGDHPNIDFTGLGRSHGFDFVFLKHAKKLDLERRSDVADLIEKQCSSGGFFEKAPLILHRAGERSFHMAEEFGLSEGFRRSPRS